MESSATLVLGNQLVFSKKGLSSKKVFMAENAELCSYYRFHKQKIAFFLSAMRHHAEALRLAGHEVHYIKADSVEFEKPFEEPLLEFIKKNKITKIFHIEIEDQFFAKRMSSFFQVNDIEVEALPSPLFLVSAQDFSAYLKKTKKPFMKSFYEELRKKTKILMTQDGLPEGGQYSFDSENREKLPTKIEIPSLLKPKLTVIEREVFKFTQQRFKDHPGELSAESWWLPTSRKDALAHLDDFFTHRFANFGPYEDAITPKSDFVFHSAISPLLNVGLLTPDEVVQAALTHYRKKKIGLASVEGFIRQIIGWREFIRGIYRNFHEKQESANFFNHQRKLKPSWYKGNTGIPPLDDAITKAQRLGYNHHIERLMIIANLMNLCQIHPHEAHRWFMEMYVDSSDWVMGPNVYGMGLFSDGGIFATKPYICSSNYILKMSRDYNKNDGKGDWCDIVDGLYWGFIDRHRSFFLKNPRLSMMVKSFDKMNAERKQTLDRASKQFLLAHTDT